MTNAPAQQWLPSAGLAPAPTSGPPLPWMPTAGYFYSCLAEEDGDKAVAKYMQDDVDEYWDAWEERAQLIYDQLVPSWWSDKRARLDFYYRKSQAPALPMMMPDGSVQPLNAWQVQHLFYPQDAVADMKDFLALRESEAQGNLAVTTSTAWAGGY